MDMYTKECKMKKKKSSNQSSEQSPSCFLLPLISSPLSNPQKLVSPLPPQVNAYSGIDLKCL